MNYVFPEKGNPYYGVTSFVLHHKIGCNNDLQEVLHHLQDGISKHVSDLGFSFPYQEEHHFYYILCRMKDEILKPLPLEERLYFITYPDKIGPLQFYRYGYVTNEKKEVLYTVVSLWVFMDSNTRRLLPAKFYAKDFNAKLPDLDKLEPLSKEKLRTLDFSSCSFLDKEIYTVQEEDIDDNKHMNNSVYVKISQRILPNKPISSFEIDFEKECYLGETLHLYSEEEENQVRVVGYKEDKTLSFKILYTF